MSAPLDDLRGVVPDEFVDTLLLLMPDAVAGPSPGETAYFPCYDPDALELGNRTFWAEPGAEPNLDFELEVRIPAGTLRARGTWLGADPPAGIAVPQSRIWIVDPKAFEIVRTVRKPALDEP